MTEPEISGSEAIRRKLLSRLKRTHLARTASDLHIALPRLEAYSQGTGRLTESEMHALCKELYPYHVRWDSEQDNLLDVSPPPQVACAAVPEPYKNPNQDVQAAFDAYQAALRAACPPETTRPKSAPEEESSGRLAKRAGFA